MGTLADREGMKETSTFNPSKDNTRGNMAGEISKEHPYYSLHIKGFVALFTPVRYF